MDQGFTLIFEDSLLLSKYNYAENFAKYCDSHLKKRNTLADDDKHSEKYVADLIILLRYIEDRDIFQKFYSRFLARRLIHASYKSLDMERNVILQLQELCGFEYTQKFQKMLMDVELSHDLNSEWKKLKKVAFDTKVLVLMTGAWPLPNNYPIEFSLPEEV